MCVLLNAEVENDGVKDVDDRENYKAQFYLLRTYDVFASISSIFFAIFFDTCLPFILSHKVDQSCGWAKKNDARKGLHNFDKYNERLNEAFTKVK